MPKMMPLAQKYYNQQEKLEFGDDSKPIIKDTIIITTLKLLFFRK